jgi:hypothetical protein
MKLPFVLLTFVTLLFISCEKTFIVLSGDKPNIELKNDKAYVNGILGKTFYKILVKFTDENPKVKDFVLENVPGSANDEWNVKSCLLIHKNGINTELLSTSEIASGGVDLFISGNSRVIADGAKIGVHSWREGKKEGIDFPRDSEKHDLFIDFFSTIEMDTAFYWYTLVAAPANDIHWMSASEIEKYQLEKE